MEQKNTDTAKIFRYVTFALFTYLAVVTLDSDINYLRFRIFNSSHPSLITTITTLGMIIDMAASVLIPVSILCKKKKVSMGGFIVLAVGVVLKGFWGFNLIYIPAYILAAAACAIEPKKAVMLTAGSAVLILIQLLLGGYFYYIPGLVRMIVRAAAIFLMAFAFDGMPTAVKAKSAGTTDDKIERLTKLKDLLDKGILTQEEFEEKKKQILDT